MTVQFADPVTTTAEDIAIFLDGASGFSFPTPAGETGESLAIALAGAGMNLGTPAGVTPETIAEAINQTSLITITGTVTVALNAWRRW